MNLHMPDTAEQQRLNDIIRLLPKNRCSILEIGARHGMMTRILTQYYSEITALDLEEPGFDIENVTKVKGDVANLEFEDYCFDVVICTEVLEHVAPERVAQACREISRVARHEVLIGIPYKQDIRLYRTTCLACGKKNPSYGHINHFDQPTLEQLFAGMNVIEITKVGPASPRTNCVSAKLMDFAGNPWGTYAQEEPCVYCGAKLQAPKKRKVMQKVAGKIATILTKIQNKIWRPKPYWIHALFGTRPQ